MATASQHSILHPQNGFGGGMAPGLGLLTTVASLPPKYRSRYLNIRTKCETPLDLSVKPNSPQIANDVPIATSFAEVYTEPSQPQSKETHTETLSPPTETEIASVPKTSGRIHPHQQLRSNVVILATQSVKPITPPLTPANKRTYFAEAEDVELEPPESKTTPEIGSNPAKLFKSDLPLPHNKSEVTPKKPIRAGGTAPKTVKSQSACSKLLKNKVTRKLKFDEETSSPVSGTIIRPLEDITDNGAQYSNGDIDPRYNIVEVTEETKAELAAIKNVIGDYVCKLCRIKFEDAFGLARHRCACIVLLEYRCPECGKQFNCPANLASHRRWHKPKKEGAAVLSQKKENRSSAAPKLAKVGANKKTSEERLYFCSECGRKFKRHAYLCKHQLTCANRRAMPTRASVDDTGPMAAGTAAVISAMDRSIAGSSYNSCNASSVSSGSSIRTHDDESVYIVTDGYEFDGDSMSECSSTSAGFGRLEIVEGGLTEEENIAATALTNLRNCASVIQHTTLAH